MASALTTVGLGAWVFLRYRPTRIAVRGSSMAPTLMPGDWALVIKPPAFAAGDVVLVEHPGRPGYEMVKRLVAVPGDPVGGRIMREDEYWVEGDFESASTDSRHFGPITREELRGRVVLIYWPRERGRRL